MKEMAPTKENLPHSAEWRSVTAMGVSLLNPAQWGMFGRKDGGLKIIVSYGAMNAPRFYIVPPDGHVEFWYPTYKNGDCIYKSRLAVCCEVDTLNMFMECGDPVVVWDGPYNHKIVADNAAAYRQAHGCRQVVRPAAWVL